MEIINQENILNDKLNLFYSVFNNFKILHDIYINPKISLRVIDWFVTNYSKKYNIISVKGVNKYTPSLPPTNFLLFL